MNMQSIMAQAQKMQRDLQKKKDELNKELFPGKSDWVEVVFNGSREIQSVKILFEGNITQDDKEMLEDMFLLAVKDSMQKIDKAFQDKMGSYAGMLDGLM
ncbi:MAG: YbaB/EbfC family nucleoid-associated protein [Bacilli bacterium]|jgi:DNA-binding YbaB/EbfC family protein|nr:YbaB/EbfC family nucleoid-associated protein [Bacilli bacterium]